MKLCSSDNHNTTPPRIRKFNGNFEKLQSELIVVKQVNSVLPERLVSMVVVPRSVSGGDLE